MPPDTQPAVPDTPLADQAAPATPREWTPADVLRSAIDGDPAALRTLVTDAHPHVQRFARHLCATEDDAADAAQEALVVLFRKVGTLRAAGALTGWMFRVVARECLRRARTPREHLAVLTDLTESLKQADGPTPGLVGSVAEDPETEVLRRLEAERIADAIAALPPVQRRVLVLRDVQGLPGREVAGVLGLSLPAMKSQLHRARADVRARLSGA